jgi:hypothetical protein
VSTNGSNGQSSTAPAGEGVIGISCSGGGIRAAAYAIGCLQALEAHEVLHGAARARYLSAVSGGSYAVGAMALVELSRQDLCSASASSNGNPSAGTPARAREKNLSTAAFAPCSPELRKLRNELGYLTHGPGGLRSELWRAVMGVVMNVALFVSSIAIIGAVAGWIYGWRFSELRMTHATSIHPSTLAWATPLVLGGLALVCGLVWVLKRWPPKVLKYMQPISVGLLLSALAAAIVLLVLPQVLGWMHRAALPRHDTRAAGVGTGIRGAWASVGGLAGIAVALAGVFAPAWKALGKLESNKTVDDEVKGLLAKAKPFLLSALTTLAVPLLFGGVLLMFMYHASEHSVFVAGASSWQCLWLAAPALFLALVWRFGDLNSWSLHAIYRNRLAEAFNLERTSEQPLQARDEGSNLYAQTRKDPVCIGELARLRDFPQVLICATSNIRNYGLVPTGTSAASFLISGVEVGGDVVGTLDTSRYCSALPQSMRPFTVMDAVSISGAAVAPQWGKMTRPPLRFLMALANIRLGVWMPKPKVAEEAAARKRCVRPPGLVYLKREARGATPLNASSVYVTDGGHYDNLGLVELLKRRCEWIWCIDASGDGINTFSTLGQAIALARAEFGIEVAIDPIGEMQPGKDTPDYVKSPFCKAKITYPPTKTGGVEGTGTLVVVKAGVPSDAPWAVDYYRAAHPSFPCDSTLHQLYTAERFDAYVALGNFSMELAFKDGSIAENFGKLQRRLRDTEAAEQPLVSATAWNQSRSRVLQGG